MFDHPLQGWIAGVDLKDLPTAKPRVFNGQTGAKVSIINLSGRRKRCGNGPRFVTLAGTSQGERGEVAVRYLHMAAPLDFLSPLVAVESTLSAGVAVVANLLIASMVVTPLLLLLQASPLERGVWRLPFAWFAVPLLSMAATHWALPKSIDEGGFASLGGIVAWLVVMLAVSAPRLIFRLARYVFTGRLSAGGRRVDRTLGALGFAAAALGLLGALTAGRPGMAVLSLLIAALAWLSFRQTTISPAPAMSSFGARVAWLLGTLLIAVSSPPLVAFWVIVVSQGWPERVNNGVLLTAGSLIVTAVGLALLRSGLRGLRGATPVAG